MEKAKLNALAVRARDGSEETLLDLWNAVKGFVKKKAVYYAKNHTAGMTTAEDLVQAGFSPSMTPCRHSTRQERNLS